MCSGIDAERLSAATIWRPSLHRIRALQAIRLSIVLLRIDLLRISFRSRSDWLLCISLLSRLLDGLLGAFLRHRPRGLGCSFKALPVGRTRYKTRLRGLRPLRRDCRLQLSLALDLRLPGRRRVKGGPQLREFRALTGGEAS